MYKRQALGVVVAILVVLGVWTALGIVTYQELRTNSVAEQVLPSKGHSESFSSMSEEILQGDERETSSKKDTVGKHMDCLLYTSTIKNALRRTVITTD